MAGTNYIYYGLNLTDNQLEKIIKASTNHEGVVLRISKDNRNGDVHKIPLTNRQINRIKKTKIGLILSLSSTQLKYLEKSGGLLPLLALLPLIFGGLGAAGAVAGGISSAVSSAKNISNAAAQLAETERHNREIETQLKNSNGIISDGAAKIPVLGPYVVPILERLGLGLSDINTLKQGGCVDCNGMCLKSHGDSLFVGKGLNLGTQSSQGNVVFSRTEAPMIDTFAEFVGAFFKDIRPLSNFDIMDMCKKMKITNFQGCFMRDEINSSKYSEKYNSDECFIMNTDESSSSGTNWTAVNVTDGITFYFDSYGLEPTIGDEKNIATNLAFLTRLKFRNPTK